MVTGELIDPSGDDIKLENVVTNATGQTSYSWTIDDNYESGNYTAYVTVTVGDSEPKNRLQGI